jgi:IclR family acetate operon transcriptional repressor
MAYELQTLERALELLAYLEADHPMRLVDLNRSAQTNATTTLRTLRVLERHGYVRRSASGMEYYLGPRLIELGQAATASIDMLSTVQPWTTELARSLNMTVHVGMLHAGAITIIAKLDPPDTRVRYSALGTRMPLHATAAGKASLALQKWSTSELEEAVSPMHSFTPSTIVEIGALQDSINEAAERGYSMEVEEYNVGFGCVGTSFRLNDEIYTVSLSGAIVPLDELMERGERLRASAVDFRAMYGTVIDGLGEIDR